VEQQNQATLATFATAAFAQDRDALAAIFNRPDNIPFVVRRGAHLHNIWQDANNPRSLWRRTTLASFRTREPRWDILLDVDALATAEGQDWS
jgi:prolyl oligopeptidase